MPVAASDALVFPSTFPEAFGMVAAEAAAAGALPVSAATRAPPRSAARSPPSSRPAARGLVSFELDDDAVAAIAARLDAWLALDGRRARGRERRRCAATVERLWSWDGVARDGARGRRPGELDGLPRAGRAIETPETSAAPGDRRRRRDQ